jgi:hypothetical protein
MKDAILYRWTRECYQEIAGAAHYKVSCCSVFYVAAGYLNMLDHNYELIKRNIAVHNCTNLSAVDPNPFVTSLGQVGSGYREMRAGP